LQARVFKQTAAVFTLAVATLESAMSNRQRKWRQVKGVVAVLLQQQAAAAAGSKVWRAR
jgi:hypothetical protein